MKLYVPDVEGELVTFKVEERTPSGDFWKLTKDGTILAVGGVPLAPDDDASVALRLSVPVNRLKELSVTSKRAELPGGIVRVLGLALWKKSGGAFETLQAVNGCSSHPEKLCDESFSAGFQKTNP